MGIGTWWMGELITFKLQVLPKNIRFDLLGLCSQAAVLQESVGQAYRVAVIGLCLLSAAALSIWLLRRH